MMSIAVAVFLRGSTEEAQFVGVAASFSADRSLRLKGAMTYPPTSLSIHVPSSFFHSASLP